MSAVLKIKNRRFDFFNDTEIALKYADIASTFSFKGYFDAASAEHRSLFRPFTYPRVTIETENRTRLITGVALNNSFASTSKTSLAAISGYSKTGVLGDCPIPVSAYPIEFTNLSLKEISENLCGLFGISVVLGDNSDRANEPFDEITSSTTSSIASFLNNIAAQKNLVLSSTSSGSLLIQGDTIPTKPRTTFNDGQPGVKLKMGTKGQGMHSEITVLKQASIDGSNAAQEVINNPFVSDFRPTTKSQSTGTDSDTVQAAKNSLANEFRNIQLSIEINRWTWPGTNEIMLPNNLIAVHDHDLFLIGKENFFVDAVTLRENPKDGQTATLKCVIPEVYNGQTPKNIFA